VLLQRGYDKKTQGHDLAGVLDALHVQSVGADHSFGPKMAEVMRFVASNVTEGIVPNSGHWIMEENPDATIALVTDFISK
jgi:pimeloyl-ACP methyl ester carboxylesterase